MQMGATADGQSNGSQKGGTGHADWLAVVSPTMSLFWEIG